MKQLLATLFLLAIPSGVFAQANIYHLQLPIQPTCKISWQQTGLDTNGNATTVTAWAMALNGAKSNLPSINTDPGVLPNGNTSHWIPCPGFAVGNTILVLFLYNDAGESGPSPEIQVIADPPPVIKYAPRPPTDVKVMQ